MPKFLLFSLSTTLLVIAAMLPTSCTAKSPETLREYVVTLSDQEADRTICTGVAIGPHEVMTAHHCMGKGVPRFNHGGCPTDAIIAYDGTDNVVVRTCMTFDKWARVAKGSPRIGQRMQQWGHVLGMPVVYREGYLAAKWVDANWYPGSQVYVWDFMGAGGDSGSAIFNSRGEVVCTVSYGILDKWSWPHFGLVACYAPNFSSEDWRIIKNQ